ncbi:MAG: hypothetical protein A2Y74_05385 [Actinobacteria bacterium RBG_13_63_9]|nr:MAG: hypothetical protein A2Y74_05385 [Actinobacteria bacterium RBG_13_63_9]
MATRKRVSGTVPNLILVFENGKLAVVGKRLPTKRPSKKRATKRPSKKRATKRPSKKRATKKKSR